MRLPYPADVETGNVIVVLMISLTDLPDQPSLLIRISREWRHDLTEDQLYDRVRRYWRVRPERQARPPVLAYGVANGVIRAVYEIERWETYDMARVQKATDRWVQSPQPAGERAGFVGRPAAELQHLVGRGLSDTPKGQNPVSYFRCDDRG